MRTHACCSAVVARSLTALLMGTAGCGESAPDRLEPPEESVVATAIEDSAGVRVVAHDDGSPPDSWELAVEPAVTIGTREGDDPYLLAGVTGAGQLSDGRIVIAEETSRELRFYAADGTHLVSAGGKGSGPTEFQYLRFLGIGPGDTVFVMDPLLRKIVGIDADGRVGRQFQLPSELTSPEVVGVLDGGLAFRERVVGPAGPAGEVQRPEELLRVVGWDGDLVWEVGPFPGKESYTSAVSGASGSLPFGRGLEIATRGQYVLIGNNDSFRIRQYVRGGELTQVILREGIPAPVEAEDLDAYLDLEFSQFQDAQFRAHMEKFAREEMPIPQTKPAFFDLHLGPSGEIWVQAEIIGELAGWYVFDREGPLRAEVELPSDARLLSVEENGVLLLTRDEQGVEMVRLHQVRR